MLFLYCNITFLLYNTCFSFCEKRLYISVRIVVSNNKNGVKKNDQNSREKIRKKNDQ